MNKSLLIQKIALKSGLSKASATWVLDSILKSVTEVLSDQDVVKIADVGTFSVISRAERTGRSPKTGEIVTFSARKSVKFSPSKSLKLVLNQSN